MTGTEWREGTEGEGQGDGEERGDGGRRTEGTERMGDRGRGMEGRTEGMGGLRMREVGRRG